MPKAFKDKAEREWLANLACVLEVDAATGNGQLIVAVQLVRSLKDCGSTWRYSCK